MPRQPPHRHGHQAASGWEGWSGWSGNRTWNWSSGWDEAAWSSAGWQEGFWQDDGGDNSLKDQGGDVGVPERSSSVESEGQSCAGEACTAPEEVAGGPSDPRPDEHRTEEDADALRRYHEAALRRFLLDEGESGSDDDVATAGARTQMLVDEDSDIDTGIAEFDAATGGVTCKLCNICLNSKSQWSDHKKGKKYEKKVRAEERKRGATAQDIFQ